MTVPGTGAVRKPERRRRDGWFLAYTNERSERRVVEAVRRRGLEAQIFTEKVKRQVRGRLVVEEPALFPRYAFLGLAADEFMELRGTPGLERIVRLSDGRPARVADELERFSRSRSRWGEVSVGP